MFSFIKSKLRSLVLRLPLIGRGLRLASRMEEVPTMSKDILGRITALNDQFSAQPNLWAPITEQVWEAQAAATQVMADDLRVALERFRREQVELLKGLHRRLDDIEERLTAETNSHAA